MIMTRRRLSPSFNKQPVDPMNAEIQGLMMFLLFTVVLWKKCKIDGPTNSNSKDPI